MWIWGYAQYGIMLLSRQLLAWTATAAAIFAAITAAVLAAFREIPLALGTLLGCLLGLGSISALWWLISHLTRASQGAAAVRGLVILNVGKYAIICVAIWSFLHFGASGVGLAVGLGIVYLALMVGGFVQARRLRKVEEA